MIQPRPTRQQRRNVGSCSSLDFRHLLRLSAFNGVPSIGKLVATGLALFSLVELHRG
jgi:hypothetical protein